MTQQEKTAEIDTLVANHYRDQSLSTSRLEAILACGEAQARKAPKTGWRLWFNHIVVLIDGFRAPQLAGVAVTALLALMVTSSLLIASWRSEDVMKLESETILAGFSAQHDALDMPNHRFVTLANAGDSLPMVKINLNPNPQRVAGLILTGGNYCNMGGILGAELQYMDKQNNRRMTLFAMPMQPAFTPMVGQTMEHEGLVFENWQQGDVFYSLARPRDCQPEKQLAGRPCARGTMPAPKWQ